MLVANQQKGSTRDPTTAVGRVGSCQPYISSCARRTIYPHILLNRGPGVSLSMGPSVIHLHDTLPCQNYNAFISSARGKYKAPTVLNCQKSKWIQCSGEVNPGKTSHNTNPIGLIWYFQIFVVFFQFEIKKIEYL